MNGRTLFAEINSDIQGTSITVDKYVHRMTERNAMSVASPDYTVPPSNSTFAVIHVRCTIRMGCKLCRLSGISPYQVYKI